MMMSISGLKNRTLCRRCGGWVHAVEEGQQLPGEFQLSTKGIIRASVRSALAWACSWYVVSMTMVVPPNAEALDDARKKALAEAFWALSFQLSLCGAVAGIALAVTVALLAGRRDDLNEPFSAEMMPAGQAAVLIPVVLLGIAAGLLLSLKLTPDLADEILTLRGPTMRGVVGSIQGLLGGSISHWLVFRYCRLITGILQTWIAIAVSGDSVAVSPYFT